ncbi:hypothetical protein HY992_00385 [Candidatus Micrarchaeota archaeon]|nr:hypothetical protein [Candidatus Micrarchaeota archaeon]
MDDERKAAILVDNREDGELVVLLEELGAVVKTQALPVGDFVLSERVVCERKTRSDFEQSLIDGRLFEQARRMRESFDCVFLVVEGESFEERVRREALLGALSALLTDFGVSVFFTRDRARTAELLFAVAKREQLVEKRELRLLGVKRVFTLAQQQQLVLETLPFVGPKLAKQLLAHFGSVQKVVNASVGELLEVEKMGEKKAKAIRKVFSSLYEEEKKQ